MKDWSLHERLAADTLSVGDLTLSRLLLMNDAHYPWLILVPRRSGIREMHHLPEAEQHQLWREIAAVSRAMEHVYAPDKLNVAALGNLVPQLHVHLVARFRDDPAWPAPVWGRLAAKPYAPAEAGRRISALAAALEQAGVEFRRA